jgi:hypothetical protein
MGKNFANIRSAGALGGNVIMGWRGDCAGLSWTLGESEHYNLGVRISPSEGFAVMREFPSASFVTVRLNTTGFWWQRGQLIWPWAGRQDKKFSIELNYMRV